MRHFWSSNQYSLFRILFGIYLTIHFSFLLPWSAELFSAQGMLKDSVASPLFGIIPNLLQLSDTPLFVSALMSSALFAAILFVLGLKDRLAAIWILYVLICIFARNPLIANPALPYVGWMLLAHLFVPSIRTSKRSMSTGQQRTQQWIMPKSVYYAAVVILALSYSYSGYIKLLSPSWVSGEAIGYVLENPLARINWLVSLLQWLPPICLKSLTWFILYVELLYAPLALIRGTHQWLWLSMLFVQIGFLLLLSFPDLTVAMLLFHLLTFDPRWIKSKLANSSETVYYDGKCGFCLGYVKLLLEEDKENKFYFAPIGGQRFLSIFSTDERDNFPTSMLVSTDNNQLLMKSDAVIHCLNGLGGLWRIIAIILSILPKLFRDFCYDCFARIRRHILAKPESTCPIVPKEIANRFWS